MKLAKFAASWEYPSDAPVPESFAVYKADAKDSDSPIATFPGSARSGEIQLEPGSTYSLVLVAQGPDAPASDPSDVATVEVKQPFPKPTTFTLKFEGYVTVTMPSA